MLRREFIFSAASALAPRLAGSVLVHEHVLVDFGGWQVAGTSRYNEDEVFRMAKPKLDELKPLGCRRLQECTPNFLGRNPRLLARLQDATGIELWSNTGIYGAADRKGVPDFALKETAAQLAQRWIDEARNGIDGIKPRFIKTAVGAYPLEPIDKKLIEAAALACRETGLVICSHTNGRGPSAMAQLDILAKMRAPAPKFVWVHAQSEKDQSYHEQVGLTGAWVEFDGINAKSADWHMDCVRFMRGKRLLNRTLISQDSGWYHVGEPGGGRYSGYTYIYTDFLPRLSGEDARQLLVLNPVECFGA